MLGRQMSDPIYADLNEQQTQAVAHGSGPLMVLAGAGSGKTRVVTRRIARLLRDGVPGGAILAMTFTNKAAGEMAQRVQELGGEYVRVATFHSVCARFLRTCGHRLGYPADYTIYDTEDRDSCIKELMQDAGISTAQIKPAHIGNMISTKPHTCGQAGTSGNKTCRGPASANATQIIDQIEIARVTARWLTKRHATG